MAEYTPLGTFNDSIMSDEDKAYVQSVKDQWNAAMAAGDTDLANQLHNDLENFRMDNYGYKGGADGSQYIPKPVVPPDDGGGSSGSVSGASESYINSIYDAYSDAKEAALKSAYDQNVLAAQAARSAIPGTYYDARNSTAGTAAINRGNFNEYAAASGLNSGAGGQAVLSMNNALQSDLSSLDKQQAKDISAIDLQMAQLMAQYQGEIAAAIAEGQFQKAQALLQQWQIDDANARTDRQFDTQINMQKDDIAYQRDWTAAQATGDYSEMYKWGWTPAQIAQKNAEYKAKYSAPDPGGPKSDPDPTKDYWSLGLGPINEKTLESFIQSGKVIMWRDAEGALHYKWADGANPAEQETNIYDTFITPGMDALKGLTK